MNPLLRNVLGMFVALSLVTGVAYPLFVTAIGQIAFPSQASGSVIQLNGEAVGSSLLGQPFSDAGHFWGRPSATSPQPCNGAASSGSNLSPTNPTLVSGIANRVAALRALDPDNTAPVPVDLVTASGSGLDPHVSPAAAEYQVARVARSRGLDPTVVRALVARHTEPRTFGLLGEPRVNVLTLNLELDATSR